MPPRMTSHQKRQPGFDECTLPIALILAVHKFARRIFVAFLEDYWI